MKVALLSDIHDHIWHLKAALAAPQIQACEQLLCCGDLCAPFIMAALAEDFPGRIHVVFGNNDADTFRITSIAGRYGDRVKLHGEVAALELAGQHIALNHYPAIARDQARSGQYDLVCFGHNHQAEVSTEVAANGRAVKLLNPGPLMGMALGEGGAYRVAHSFMVLDLSNLETAAYQVSADFGVEKYAVEGA